MGRKSHFKGDVTPAQLSATLSSITAPVRQPVAIRARMVEWVDGVPTVVTKDVIPANAVSQLAMAALSAPYDDSLGLFPQYKGMTNLEVALLKAAGTAADGSLQHLESLLNRGAGTPKSTSEVKQLNMSYQDLLDAMAREEKQMKSAQTYNVDRATGVQGE